MATKNEIACRLLCVTDKLYKSITDSNYEEFGVYAGQLKVLMYLADRGDNHASQKEIAETFGVSPSAVAVTLKKLENEGFVTRKSLDKDNRVNHVVLTKKALEITSKTKHSADALCDKLFADFTDEELSVLNTLLDKLGNKL